MSLELLSYPESMAVNFRQVYFTDDCLPSEAFPRIFQDYKITVQYAEFGENLHKNDANDGWIITLPVSTPAERDNYTIAHEIGHIVLKHRPDNKGMFYLNGTMSKEERQANIFATELLMPKKLFVEVCKDLKNDMYEVAAKFGVSPATAGTRIEVLGIE